MNKADPEFLAWFAGFWEGEGWMVTKAYRYQIAIAQNNPEPLFLIRDKLGGRVWLPKNKGYPLWCTTSRTQALEIARKVLPFLKFRRKEVEEKIHVLETLPEGPHHYTRQEDEFIQQNWRELSDSSIGKVLRRSWKSVQHRRLMLGIKKELNQRVLHGGGQLWRVIS